jgi:hypothetical protein
MSVPLQVSFNFEVVSSVPHTAKQETETYDPAKWEWVEAVVWTERMLAALVNGVKDGGVLIPAEHWRRGHCWHICRFGTW